MDQPKHINHHYAGVFLITDKIIGQLRDNKSGIDNPGKVGSFGGTINNDEDPKQAARRELKEETNLKFDENELTHFYNDVALRNLTQEWETRDFYYLKIDNTDNLEIFEGQGWTVINGKDDPRLIEGWDKIIERLIKSSK